MRILALDHPVDGALIALEIIEAFYDYDDFSISFYTMDKEFYFIPNITVNESNQICSKLGTYGFCDVTRYGEIQKVD